MVTIPQAVREIAFTHADRPAVIYGDKVISYAELGKLMARAAAGFASLGVGEGDRVAIVSPNSSHFIVAFLGAMEAGAAVVPINPMLKPPEVAFILADAGVKVAVVFGELAKLVIAAAEDLEATPRLVTIGDCPAPGAASLTDWLATGPDTFGAPDMMDTRIAEILYTSGTTGWPKGAMLSHHNILWDSASCAEAIQFSEEDVILAALPMFHSYASTVGVILPLRVGACSLVVDRFVPLETAAVMRRHRCTVLPAVPAMCAALLRAADELPEGAFDSLRMVVCGGAPMPVELMRAFEERFGLIVIEGDGPTECSPVTSVNRPDRPRKPGSIGTPIPGCEMRIVDDDDNELPDGKVGEICVRGPNVMVGYLNQPEATMEAMRGGWFHTGDLGYRDDDGYFFIVDRKKDMIIVGGLNVYPREVEVVLAAYPGVAEVAVIGQYDDIRGEKVKAFVRPAEGADVSVADLTRHCRERLANFKVPKEIVFVKDFPRTLKGTVLKRELRDCHSGGSGGGAGTA